MPLTIFFGLLTLAPLVIALAIAGLGLARRATPGLTLGLTLAGVVIPILGLALLATEVSAGFPLEIALLGNQLSWVALYGRADALSVYAAIGVAVIVAPLLLWLAWRAAPLDEAEEAELAATEVDDQAEDSLDASSEESTETSSQTPQTMRTLGRWQWTGVAIALALESLALWVCFAENIALLGIVWVALVVAAWGLGELGSETAILDWRGLGPMVAGPIVWLVTTLLIAGPAGARRLLDLTGAARLPMGHLLVISLALVFAAGGYPALAWLRKRASISSPAGLAAVSLAVMPAALLVGARTFSIGATLSDSWPALNIGRPSITIGIVLTLLGAVSVALAGLQALGRRDPRSLLAALTLAQAGWGLVGLGVGAPVSLLGVTLLLATSVIGLGAVISSLVAGGAITADVEPDSAGPRIFGEPLRPALLFAWLAGAASLVGAPLFAGFAPQQLITGEGLTGPRPSIPLIGLAWIGSVLLAIALTRAIAPAFSAPVVAVYDEETELDDGEVSEAEGTEEAEEQEASELPAPPPELRLEELPGIALGALILIAGVAPGVALIVASGAAGATLQAGALNDVVASSSSGYTAGVGQWFATAPVIFVAVASLALAYVRSRMPREIRPLYVSGQEPAELAAAAVDESGEAEPAAELAALPEPVEAWSELRPAFRSGWLTPGAAWLGLEEANEADDDGDSADGAESVAGATDNADSEQSAESAKGPATTANGKGGAAPRSDAISATSERAAGGAGDQS
ncbi:MAG TPA: proton-conducting transporter membrane subunit [Ktedonobacterales bacterium]